MEKDALNMSEAAKRLGVCKETVRRLIAAGDLPSIRISPRRVIIPAEALTQWRLRRSQGA